MKKNVFMAFKSKKIVPKSLIKIEKFRTEAVTTCYFHAIFASKQSGQVELGLANALTVSKI